MIRPEFAARMEKTVADGCIDFGELTAEFQENVLRRICSEHSDLQTILTNNPFLCETIHSHDGEYLAESLRNAEIVRQSYSLVESGRRLITIYRSVSNSLRHASCEALEHGERILDYFLNLDRFRAVRL
jgi:hypothetical protein